MKSAQLFALSMFTLLSACSAQPNLNQLRAPRANAVQMQMSAGQRRSDEGLRKGVIELRKVRFQKWDKNVDGVLTRNEVSDEQMVLPGVISGFKDYDADGNGQITQTEFLREDTIQFWMGIIRPKVDELFTKHDKDGNRLITKDEADKIKLFFSPWPQLKGGDLNGDGVIHFSEFEDAYMTVLPFFQQNNDQSRQLPQM